MMGSLIFASNCTFLYIVYLCSVISESAMVPKLNYHPRTFSRRSIIVFISLFINGPE